MLIVDAHLDLAYNVERGRDVRRAAGEQPVVDNEIATVGFPEIRSGGVGLICATVFCPPASYHAGGYVTADDAHAAASRQLEWYGQRVADGSMEMVRESGQLPGESQQGAGPDDAAGAIKFILLLEGGDAFRGPDDVGRWYDQGLRIVGLSWRRTRMAGGTGSPGPLTDEGRAVVDAMDALGMIHDVSHLAEEAFWQLLEASGGPIMASHSNCRTFVPTDRHLSDDMIKALISRGAVIGMNFYDKFLMPPAQRDRRRANLEDLLRHVKHICEIAGNANHVGIGTDMDGGIGREQLPEELSTIADLPKVARKLSGSGFNDEDVRKIMGENWVRFFGGALRGG